MENSPFLPAEATQTYVDIVLPIAIPQAYTYSIPENLVPQIRFGQQVEVQFGKNKLYAGLVTRIHQEKPTEHKAKPLLSLIDPQPVINERQFALWQWIADYYACTLGEVMNAALPSHLKLASETKVVLSPMYDQNFQGLSDKEFLVAEALSIQSELSIADIQGILQQKTVYPVIHQLLQKKIVYLEEEMKSKFQPKTVACVALEEPYASNQSLLEEAFELVSRSQRQQDALMSVIQLSKKREQILRQEIFQQTGVDNTVLKALEKKGILRLYDKETSRLTGFDDETQLKPPLSEAQSTALETIRQQFEQHPVVLLHGVTGSGKTRLYIELIEAALAEGGQVLYLLPEIALTTQIVQRLQKIFGDQVAVYHSRLSNNERVEMWQSVSQGKALVLGARSSLFLPFHDLRMVIVDEEHDPSFKQQDPAPRYHGRDTAIYLATLHKSKVLLGTATPALESYYNCKKGKYGLVELQERYGGLKMPEIRIADQRQEQNLSHFTKTLLDTLHAALEKGEQAILFQNRRGYAPTIRCQSCGWNQSCIHCDVSLTYHKFKNNLQCHYCGYRAPLPRHCPACGGNDLRLQGFGTEKIEDEIKLYLPEAKIGRMDLDTVRTKNAHAKIINDFEEKRLDILVGTQMVTKGLDFEHVGVVGVLSADQLLQFPDFRASERAFQLITQVAGRSGRKHQQGLVIVQALNRNHPVLKEILENDYTSFYQREIQERQAFRYPPFKRLIKITLKHKKTDVLQRGGQVFGTYLKQRLGSRVIGPATPHVSRIRGQYLLDLLIKLEKDVKIGQETRRLILEAGRQMHHTEGCSGIRINVDVDPN